MTYFRNVNTLEELRKQYKELLKQYHPDNGGSVEIMQEINSEYDRLFKALPKDSTENAKSAAGAAGASTSADGVTDAMRAVLESVGITDVLAKSKGSSNPHNLVKATIAALSELRSPAQVAQNRGISLEKVFKG